MSDAPTKSSYAGKPISVRRISVRLRPDAAQRLEEALGEPGETETSVVNAALEAYKPRRRKGGQP